MYEPCFRRDWYIIIPLNNPRKKVNPHSEKPSESKWSDHCEIFFVKRHHKSRETLKLDLDAVIEDEHKYGKNPINYLNLLDNSLTSNGNKRNAHHLPL